MRHLEVVAKELHTSNQNCLRRPVDDNCNEPLYVFYNMFRIGKDMLSDSEFEKTTVYDFP